MMLIIAVISDDLDHIAGAVQDAAVDQQGVHLPGVGEWGLV